MRVLVGVMLSACALEGTHRQTDFPTLAPDHHAKPMPIDPYAADPTPPKRHDLHGVVGDHVPSDVDFGDPGAVVAMTVRVDIGTYRLPSHAGNHVDLEAGQTQLVSIHVEPGAKVTATERADALRATATIDARTPAIVKAAKQATARAHTDRQKVAALVDWVHSNITYVLSDETLASRVLDRGVGDCSEMSLLFVALARAANIPARRVDGLAATEADGQPAFGFHAWAEVALDGKWVQVDPTWDEDVADATHILLREPEGDLDPILADIKVAVIDIHRDRALVGHADVRQLARELPVYLQLRRR